MTNLTALAGTGSSDHETEKRERECFGFGRMRSIGPSGGRGLNTRAGIFWELPLGMLASPNGALVENNKNKKDFGATSHPATLSDPKHPLQSEASAFKSFRLVATVHGEVS